MTVPASRAVPGVNVGDFPQTQFECIGAAAVSARHERRFRGGDRLEGGNRVVGTDDMRAVGSRPNDDEVVPRYLPAIDAVAVVNEFLFGLGIMDEHKVSVATARGI